MKWAVIIVLWCVTMPHLTTLSHEVGKDRHGVNKIANENEKVVGGKLTVETDSHSTVVNSGESSISDNSEQMKLFKEVQKLDNFVIKSVTTEQSIIDQKDLEAITEEKMTNAEEILLQQEGTANTVSDDIFPAVEVEKTSQEQSEKPHILNTQDNMDPDTSKEGNAEGVASKTDRNKVSTQDDDNETGVSTKKQRYFPLLYTVGSMFTSFLAEFGEVSGSSDSTSSNSSILKNITFEDGSASNVNTTSNSTDPGKKTRFQCALHLKNTTSELNGTALVKIINSTELLEILNFSKNQKSAASPCVLVMFYTKWCHFSARAAPEYNALARAFPQLDVLAVDTSHFSYLNAKFGTVAVPNIMIFHSRSAVRFNHTTRDLDHFVQFVHNNTGLEPSSSIAVLPEDFEGPLSSKVVQGRDWLLWLAWAFILVCSIYGFFFSLYGQAVIMRFRVLWAEHQHIE